MIPNDPFLNENQPLPPGVELQLSFDRLAAKFSTYHIGTKEETLKGQTLKLTNVYAQVEYVSSPALRQYADSIQNAPIVFKYDDCSVLYKTLSTGEQSMHIENIKGGKTPDYIFIGLVETSALNGNSDESPTKFKCHGVKEINLTLNGNPCLGFPIKITNNYPMWPYLKFHDVLGKLQNNGLSTQMTMVQFRKNMLYAHKFQGEESDQGWIGVSLTTENAAGFQKGFTLGNIRYCNFQQYNY